MIRKRIHFAGPKTIFAIAGLVAGGLGAVRAKQRPVAAISADLQDR